MCNTHIHRKSAHVLPLRSRLTTLIPEVMGPDTIIARTGLLHEGRDKFDVGAEIYGEAKMKWKEITQAFETLPPS